MKKVCSILLVFAMVLCMTFGAFAQEEISEVYTVDSEAVAEAQALLSSISKSDIFDEITAEPVTRGDFITAVTDLAGVDGALEGQLPFEDVPVGSEYAAGVYNALQMGLISTGTSFRPNDTITYNEAVKIAVSAMGYSTLANYSGGYPTGYLKVANDKDVLEYIEAAPAVTEEVMTVLLYNMLRGEILDVEYITEDSVKYEYSGTTMLYDVHGILYTEGLITGTFATSYDISYRYTSGASDVLVDGKKFKSETGFNEYFGMNCVVYYSEEVSGNKIVAAYPVNNREITISLDDVESFSGTMLRYYPDEKSGTKSLKVDSNYTEVYNGKVTNADADRMLSIKGDVRLVDNDDDGTYDVIFVNSYGYVKVKNLDITDRVIEDMYSAENNISIDETDVLFNVKDSRGNIIRLADIQPGDMLCVLKSLDGSVADISVINELFSGEVQALTDDGKVVIGDTEYTLSDYALVNCVSELKIGASVSFCPGRDGEIAYIDIKSDVYNYGYVIKTAQQTGFENNYQIKMFTSSGIMKIYDFAEKVTYNGTKEKDSDAFSLFTESFEPQLIRYRLNGDGMISAIDTSVTVDMSTVSIEDMETEKSEDDKLTKNVYADTSFSFRSNGSFGTSFNGTGALIFALPVAEGTTSVVDVDNEEEFDMMSISEIRSGTVYSYFDVYDVDEYGAAKVIVSYNVARNSSPHSFVSAMSSNFTGGMISKIRNGISAGEEIGYQIEIWTNGKFNKYFMGSDVSVPLPEGDKLSVGDVVRFKLKNGEIEELIVDINADKLVNNRAYDNRSAAFNAGDTFLTYQVGQLYSFNTSVCSYSVVIDEETGAYDFAPVNQCISQMRSNNICRYDAVTGTVQSVAPADLRSYRAYGDMADIVALKQQNLSTQTIYVFGKGDE
ncbi:MAG: hypothetical protein IJ460_07890 [Clostridia bacterium]|nr:hypothetical protein [Clostridia bacterium]